jgi:hypothetical protein
VLREIGLDEDSCVVYKFPLAGSLGSFRGIFDLATFATDGKPDDISEAEFERFWQMPVTAEDQARSIRAINGPSVLDRLFSLLKRGSGR